MNDPGREVETHAFQSALRAELARRIAEVATYSEETFGRLRRVEIWASIVLCLGLPLLFVWIYA